MANSTIPVPSRSLLVRGDGELQFGKILVPVDFSIGTATQLRVARELARWSKGTLILLHVIDSLFDSGATLDDSAGEPDFHLMLEAIKLDLTRAGFLVECHCVKGSPGPQIVEMAANAGADLIVMGTHGRSGLSHVLMGSVAEHVVRRARCPVLTLRLSDVEHSHGSDERASPLNAR